MILVEGAAENMLLPHFIRNKYPKLYQRYISILSINGRHSHRLNPLIEKLCIPTLVIADIDSAEASAKRIVTLANSIRSSVDDQKQQARSDAEEGTVRLFITSKSNNKEYVEKRVAEMMVQDTGDIGWNDEEDYKSLILEHHMAASRFGFSELYMPLSNSKKFDTSLREGYGQSISAIKKEIKAVIKDVMRRIASEHNLSQGNMGAKQLISLLDYMDDSILEYENAEIPERVPSDDDIDTLVNIAIGSPAVCLYRNLKEIVDLEERKKIARECCDKSFVSMFNRPESRSIMDAVFEGKKGSSDEKHYEQVFHYCVDGNFQSMALRFSSGKVRIASRSSFGVIFFPAFSKTVSAASRLKYSSNV